MEQRAIRVFVSSTFRDMAAERDELAKRVFIELRRLCEERGVTWGEVDLRWGITDEQKAEGKVLPICLAEIQRCRPYFLGLLGERYGWIPDDIPEALIHEQPWLAEHRDRSVTDLEILHGVLNDPAMRTHAFFYFRDPAYVDSLALSEQAMFRESPLPEAIERLGMDEAQEQCEQRKARLAELKERIRRSGLPVREGYANPQVLGQLVLADLTAVIDRLLPARAIPDPLDCEAADHEAFAASRRGVYIGRRAYMDALDRHAEGDGPPLVVLGESGSGKSALLANWAAGYRQAHAGDLLVVHFIGATPHSADWMAMLRRVIGEIHRRFRIDRPIPDQPAALRTAFRDGLGLVPRKSRVVVVLDGLNQLEDRDQAPDLVWLPARIPANVRVILSTLPGRPLDNLSGRSWPTLRVEALTPDERSSLIETYLAQYTKSLAPEHANAIVRAPQAKNPLFLRALLEELRLHGEHATLGRRIAEYLEAGTVEALYARILERYEADYERERPGLVRDAMSLLWAARHGLSEAELLDMLGADGRPVPRAHWSPLFLASEPALVNRSGLIAFGHDYLRRAVAARYLPAETTQRDAHMRIAEYFEGREPGPRTVAETPWQLGRAGAWRRLYVWLSNPRYLSALWDLNRFEPPAYWAQVERHTSLRLVNAYRQELADPSKYPDQLLSRLVNLLSGTGHAGDTLGITRCMIDRHRASGDRAGLAVALGNQAVILYSLGEVDEAMTLLEEQEGICRDSGNRDELQRALGNQGVMLAKGGHASRALKVFREQERICRPLGAWDGLQESLGNQAALILENSRDLDAATTLVEEKVRICREMGSLEGLSRGLGLQAMILKERGRLHEAMALRKEEEQICRDLGNRERLGECLGYQALIRRARRDFDGAMALHKEGERIWREIGFTEGLVRCLTNQAILLTVELKRPREALPLIEEAYTLVSRTSLTVLTGQVKSVLDSVREQANVGWVTRLLQGRPRGS